VAVGPWPTRDAGGVVAGPWPTRDVGAVVAGPTDSPMPGSRRAPVASTSEARRRTRSLAIAGSVVYSGEEVGMTEFISN
jgi:hypothetical protein